MSLLFNMLSRLVIVFLLRSKQLLISWLQSPSAVILESKKISTITADGDCTREIKICLFFGRKAMTNRYNILRSRDITLPTKVFSVVKYGCENWTIKKAECRGPEAFEPWCLRRLLRVPWIARRSNQSILKEISPGCSLEGLMLKLKLQYFGYLL